MPETELVNNPLLSCNPFVRERPAAEIPPANVDVPLPVSARMPLPSILPATEKSCPGTDVAIPTFPEESIVRRLLPALFWIANKSAVCPEAARIKRGVALVLEASMVTAELPMGVVVPNDDWRVTLLTAPASCANADEVMC